MVAGTATVCCRAAAVGGHWRYPLLADTPPPYPRRCGRRLVPRTRPVEQSPVLQPKAEPPQLPSAAQAEVALKHHPHGVFGLLRQARRSNAAGDFRLAYRVASLALVAAPSDDADVRDAAIAARRAAVEGSLLQAWLAACGQEATRQQTQADRWAAVLASRDAKRLSSTPKPRQGLTKPAMKLLTVRLCCACRALRPRALMWRIMQLRPPGVVPQKPEKARVVRRRWVYPKKKKHDEADVPFVPDPAAKAMYNTIVLGRIQGSDAIPELRALMEALKKKGQAVTRGLGASVPTAVLQTMQAANEVLCRLEESSGKAVGVDEDTARRIEEHMPRIEPLPGQQGPFDKWPAPPSGPR